MFFCKRRKEKREKGLTKEEKCAVDLLTVVNKSTLVIRETPNYKENTNEIHTPTHKKNSDEHDL